jgi:hypothetical protein
MKKIYLSIVGFLLPAVSFAQSLNSNTTPISGQINNADNIISKVISGFNIAIYILISFAIVYIVWSVVKYFVMGEGEDKKEQATKIGWGILGLFIILSIWGLVSILKNTFQTSNTINQNDIPSFNIRN